MNSIARARARSAVHEEFVGGPFRLKWLAWAGLALLGGVALGAVALSLLVTLTRPAAAEEQPKCVPLPDLRAVLLKEFGEVEISGGMVNEQAILSIFAKPDGSTWTAVFVRSDGLACPAYGGQFWFPAEVKREVF